MIERPFLFKFTFLSGHLAGICYNGCHSMFDNVVIEIGVGLLHEIQRVDVNIPVAVVMTILTF